MRNEKKDELKLSNAICGKNDKIVLFEQYN